MDIHHAMIIRGVQPERVYDALTQAHDLEVWLGAPTVARPEVGAIVEIHFDQGQRLLKMEVTHLEIGHLVQWRVRQLVWPSDEAGYIITWTLTPYESSTLVDFRMVGWSQDDDIFASVSYKWASFMMRLKLYMGDTRELATFLKEKDTAISK